MSSPLSADHHSVAATTMLVDGTSKIRATMTDGWLVLREFKESVELTPLQTNQLREWLRQVRHP